MQVHIVTDDLSEEEEIYQATKALGVFTVEGKRRDGGRGRGKEKVREEGKGERERERER